MVDERVVFERGLESDTEESVFVHRVDANDERVASRSTVRVDPAYFAVRSMK